MKDARDAYENVLYLLSLELRDHIFRSWLFVEMNVLDKLLSWYVLVHSCIKCSDCQVRSLCLTLLSSRLESKCKCTVLNARSESAVTQTCLFRCTEHEMMAR